MTRPSVNLLGPLTFRTTRQAQHGIDHDPAASENGAFVDALQEEGPSQRLLLQQGPDEGWLFDRAENKLILFAPVTPTDDSKCGGTTANKAELLANLQAYWSDSTEVDSDYDFAAYGITSGSSTQCPFAAAAGLQSGVNTIGVGAGQPSIDGNGRFVVYTTNFQMANAFGTHDPRHPGPAINVFMFDRMLGITTRITVPPTMALVVGSAACCASASSSYRINNCDFDDRLQGKCCDQKPCRIGGLNAEISGDGQKIVFVSDVNYEGTGIHLPKGDLEIFMHHVPTATTKRITYTHHASSDETFPHISRDGTEIVFQSKHHYPPFVDGSESSSNQDVWMTRLTYGCDDPTATNYNPTADIAECCAYSDASIDGSGTSHYVQLESAKDLQRSGDRRYSQNGDLVRRAARQPVQYLEGCSRATCMRLRIPANRSLGHPDALSQRT